MKTPPPAPLLPLATPDAEARRSVRKPLLAALAALLAASGAWVWSVRSEARSILQERDRAAARLLDEFRGRDPARPSLLGAGEPGDAGEDYRFAIQEFETLLGKGQGHRITTADEPCIGDLRLGASRSELRWHETFAPRNPELIQRAADLLPCVVDRAWALFHEQRAGEALERLRLVLAVARDLERFGAHPSLLGDSEMYAHETATLFLAKRPLSADQLRTHADFLDRFEASRPDLRAAFRRELHAPSDRRAEPGWRELWSEDVRLAGLARDAERHAALADRIDARAAGPYPDWLGDPALDARSEAAWRVERVLQVDAARRTYARIARVAFAIAAWQAEHGRFPAEGDPWLPPAVRAVCPYSGKPFVLRPAEGRVWSFGFDLDDDGGRPVDPAEWSHWKHLRYQADGDLAAVVTRGR